MDVHSQCLRVALINTEAVCYRSIELIITASISCHQNLLSRGSSRRNSGSNDEVMETVLLTPLLSRIQKRDQKKRSEYVAYIFSQCR